MHEWAEFQHIKSVVDELRRKHAPSTFDWFDWEDLITTERAHARQLALETITARVPTYSTVAVNQLLAHLEAKRPDRQTVDLIQVIRETYRIR